MLLQFSSNLHFLLQSKCSLNKHLINRRCCRCCCCSEFPLQSSKLLGLVFWLLSLSLKTIFWVERAFVFGYLLSWIEMHQIWFQTWIFKFKTLRFTSPCPTYLPTYLPSIFYNKSAMKNSMRIDLTVSNCSYFGSSTDSCGDIKTYKGRSPGLVVMGDDSCSKGCGFELQRSIPDGHFSHWFVVKIVLIVSMDQK